MNPVLIELQGVCKTHVMGDDQVHALRDLSLQIGAGECVAVTGASGSGKSSLLNILGCLDRPTRGLYLLDGQDAASLEDTSLSRLRNTRIGFVFQTFHLLDHASALENVMLPLRWRSLSPQLKRELAVDALARVGLLDRMQHRPHQLSGGQRQRVVIARALCASPALLLADEPTGNLDRETAQQILSLFRSLHESGQTVVIVTHDPEVARSCQREIRLSDGRVLNL
ncbi:ABC transporter ATP-binding protein [Paucibacter sp. B51]|uniref:ABC transporter ATP-binding protein n=1 Tax=Paucibacter sp. B51 TaxID=2993315 RepID=UPI0022EBC341|nr:ABC transporter ATP-binding protein [Paucibacter sp. B51]